MKLPLLLAVALAGCDGASVTPWEKTPEGIRYNQMRYESEKQSRENCLKRGGIVVESAWDLKIKDCK